MRARERVDHDLFRGGGILRDGEAETEDAVAIPVEERVKRGGLAVPRRIDELVVGAGFAARGVPFGLHSVETSGR
jgi:hypothetical protein